MALDGTRALPDDLSRFIVADVQGRVVGRFDRWLDAEVGKGERFLVRRGLLVRRRRVVPVSAIDEVDPASGVIALRVPRHDLRTAKPAAGRHAAARAAGAARAGAAPAGHQAPEGRRGP